MGGCHVQPEQMFNLIFGYNDQYRQVVWTASATLGANRQYGTEVPAGEVWVVTSMCAYDGTNNPGQIAVGMYNGSSYLNVNMAVGVVANQAVVFNGLMVMKAGDKAQAFYGSCTAGDGLTFAITGYKMKLVQ